MGIPKFYAKDFLWKIQERWKISANTIEINDDLKKDIKQIYTIQDNVLIKTIELSDSSNIIETFNSDGIQIKAEYNDIDFLGSKVLIERDGIDKASCYKNGQVYIIDLTKIEDYDIATLKAAEYTLENEPRLEEKLYEEPLPESQEAKMREKKIKEMIAQSKYSEACYKYSEIENPNMIKQDR